MKNVIMTALLLSVLAACQNQSQPKPEAMPKPENPINKATFVEITSFELNKGVDLDQLKNSVAKMNETFLAKQEGFIHRTLTQKNDSIFTDVVFWKDDASASGAMKMAEQNADAGAFMQLINMQTVEFNLNKSIMYFEK